MISRMFQDIKLNKPIASRTKSLMNFIALRLSGRDDCKGLNYVLTISDSSSFQHVSFEPDVVVYPDRYHKKDTDKTQVILQILNNHFSEYTTKTEDGCVFVNRDTFVCGKYEYVSSFNNKRRKWIRNR